MSLIAITTDDESAPSNVVTAQEQTPAPARVPAATDGANGSAAGDCLARAVIVRC